jgi:TPR repeat protein
MEYVKKQILLAYQSCAEDGDEECARDLRESFEKARNAVDKSELSKDKTARAEALYNLGDHYWYGFGVEEDDDEALKYYRKAAELGYADAMNAIAWCYSQGYGVERNLEASYEWYKKTARAYYEKGEMGGVKHALHGVPVDDEVRLLLNALNNASGAKG